MLVFKLKCIALKWPCIFSVLWDFTITLQQAYLGCNKKNIINNENHLEEQNFATVLTVYIEKISQVNKRCKHV